MPPVAMVTLPLRATTALLPQITWSGPAFVVGASLKVMVMASMAAAQEPLPVVVKVKVTLPDSISGG